MARSWKLSFCRSFSLAKRHPHPLRSPFTAADSSLGTFVCVAGVSERCSFSGTPSPLAPLRPPTRVPGAPSSHASSQRRLGSPPPASLVRTARRRSAAPRLPENCCQARTRRTPPPRTPGPLPAPPQPLLPSRSPPPPLPTQPVCKEGRPRRAGSQARRVALGAAGCVGRPAGGGGRAALHSGSPGSEDQNRPGSG